jgi:hypothetical protein
VVIDGEVKIVGKIADKEEVKGWLKPYPKPTAEAFSRNSGNISNE